MTWGRGEFDETQSPGVSDYSAPLEGSIFSSLQEAGVTLENEGELVGGLAYKNYKWPSGTSADTIPDTLGGCYLAARARVHVRLAAVRVRVARQRPHLRPVGGVPQPRDHDGGERRGDGDAARRHQPLADLGVEPGHRDRGRSVDGAGPRRHAPVDRALRVPVGEARLREPRALRRREPAQARGARLRKALPERGDRERGPAARHVHVDAGLHAVRRTRPAATAIRRATRRGPRARGAPRSGTSASRTTSRGSGSRSGRPCGG